MSLLWKKPKSSRISRFMSEFQQSPKRGGSLVVETGFPTSLIDLFVKNRDRLKKSPPKRLKRQPHTAPNAFFSAKPDVALKKPEAVRSRVERVDFLDDGSAADTKRSNDKNVCVCVLMAFKVFIVSLLALSTKKKLTIGITLSAFALLLTELAATRLLSRFKLLNADKNAISRGKTETFHVTSDKKAVSCLEEKTEHVAKTEDSNLKQLRIRDLLSKDENSKSKSSRLKSKIVNKLRSYRKKKKTMKIKEETLSEVSSLVSSEDKSERIEFEREEEEGLNPSLMIGSKGDQTNGIVVMIVIVLAGLVSGKILAIILTLSCLVLKFGAAKKSSICI